MKGVNAPTLGVLVAAALARGADPDSRGSRPEVSVHAGIEAACEAAARDGAVVLIVFGAEWCGPCKILKEKVLESPAFAAGAGPLHIARLDIDASPDDAKRFQVRAIPALFLVTAEQSIIARRVGVVAAEDLIAWIDEGRARVARGGWEGTDVAAAAGATFDPAKATPEAWRSLIESLGDRDPEVRRRVAAQVRRAREAAVPHLIEGLDASYLGVRIGAAEVLASMAPAAPAVDPWAEREIRAKQVEAFRRWWEGAGRLPAPEARETLSTDEARSVDDGIREITGGDPIRRTEAMSLLVEMGPPVLPKLREAIVRCAAKGEQRSLWVLEDVRWAILIPDAMEVEVRGRRALARGASEERQAAVGRLARAGTRALPALQALLDDGDPLVREAVIRALGGIEDEEGTAPLAAIATLLASKDGNLRMVAARELGQTKDMRAAPYLVRVLADPDEVVACVAIAALQEVKARAIDCEDALLACLKDPRWRVRAAAAEAIGKLASSGDALIGLLDDTDTFVVKSAIVALKAIKYNPSEPVFDHLIALAGKEPDLVRIVTEFALVDKDAASIRRVEALYDRVDDAGRREILDVLQRDADDLKQPSRAWRSLVKKAIGAEGPATRQALAEALRALPLELARESLPDLLADASADVREEAAGLVLDVAAHDFGIEGWRGEKGGMSFVESAVEYSSPPPPKPGLFERFVRTLAGREPEPEPKPGREKPVRDSTRYAPWHAIIGEHIGADPGVRTALAFYVTGDGVEGLDRFTVLFRRPDVEWMDAQSCKRALGVFLKRLPWPAGHAAVLAACSSVRIYSRLRPAVEHGGAEVQALVKTPSYLVRAIEEGTEEDREILLESLLRANPMAFISSDGFGNRLSQRRIPSSLDIASIQALHASPEPLARAIAVAACGWPLSAEEAAIVEKGLRNPDPRVRLAAVQVYARDTRPLSEREPILAPFLSDADLSVAALAALALIAPPLQEPADIRSVMRYFQFDTHRVWRLSVRVTEDESFPAPIDRKPALLDTVRARLRETESLASDEASTAFAVLLGEYGDYGGFELLLDRWARGDRKETPAVLKIALKMTRDPRYLPALRPAIAKAASAYQLKDLEEWMEGVSGDEVVRIRAEIDRRKRKLP